MFPVMRMNWDVTARGEEQRRHEDAKAAMRPRLTGQALQISYNLMLPAEVRTHLSAPVRSAVERGFTLTFQPFARIRADGAPPFAAPDFFPDFS
jgi:hypothetical protein